MEQRLVYLDHAATTPVCPAALQAAQRAMQAAWGNPSSHYSLGYQAKELLDTARAQVASALNAHPQEIFFTGSGSEADNWGIKGVALRMAQKGKKHLVTTAFEHHAVLHSMAALERMGFAVSYVKPNREGIISPQAVQAALRPDTALVSVMLANNEIGTLQPIAQIAELVHRNGAVLHTDAVQAVGNIPVDVQALGVDLLSLSGHKFGAPKGVGALYVKKGVQLWSLIDGGSQEGRRRAGTENLPGIAALGAALEQAAAELPQRMDREQALRDYTIDRLLRTIPQTRLNGSRTRRLPGNVNLSFPGLEGETILLDLDLRGICASTGSACNSDSLDPSHVLLSIGLPEEIGHGSMRFAFGPENTQADAEYLCQALEQIVPMRRAMSCMWLQDQGKARTFETEGA